MTSYSCSYLGARKFDIPQEPKRRQHLTTRDLVGALSVAYQRIYVEGERYSDSCGS